MDQLIPAWRPDQILINRKKTYQFEDFAIPIDHRVKIKERLKLGQVPRPCLRTENIVEHESDNDTNNM